MARAGDIGQQALQRIGLDHRHVLQRRGVEHQFRPPALEHGTDARLIADVDQQRLARDVRVALGQFQVDQPQRVFAIVEQDQPLRAQRGDLARQFAADRAAGAGHDDAPALDQPRHALAVERHLRAVQQVLDRHRPQFELARAGPAEPAGSSDVGRGARRIRMP